MYFQTPFLPTVAENLLAVKVFLAGLGLVPEFPSLEETACWQADCFPSGQSSLRLIFFLAPGFDSESVLWMFVPVSCKLTIKSLTPDSRWLRFSGRVLKEIKVASHSKNQQIKT